MLATISDCLLRKGFLGGSSLRRLSLPVVTGGGVTIGMIAALLGVGGSVMTVPLLRRHGYAMRECISASNPLSLPVALCGAVTYAVMGWQTIPVNGFLGFINLKILGMLVLTGWAGIVLAVGLYLLYLIFGTHESMSCCCSRCYWRCYFSNPLLSQRLMARNYTCLNVPFRHKADQSVQNRASRPVLFKH